MWVAILAIAMQREQSIELVGLVECWLGDGGVAGVLVGCWWGFGGVLVGLAAVWRKLVI